MFTFRDELIVLHTPQDDLAQDELVFGTELWIERFLSARENFSGTLQDVLSGVTMAFFVFMVVVWVS